MNRSFTLSKKSEQTFALSVFTEKIQKHYLQVTYDSKKLNSFHISQGIQT